MGDVSYSAYLKGEHWQAVRRAALERAGGRCQICGSRRYLQAHHNTYANLGDEQDKDLIILCDDCHARHSAAMRPQPLRVGIGERPWPPKWYPGGREGEIIRALEVERDPLVVRALLAEKIVLDKRRR